MAAPMMHIKNENIFFVLLSWSNKIIIFLRSCARTRYLVPVTWYPVVECSQTTPVWTTKVQGYDFRAIPLWCCFTPGKIIESAVTTFLFLFLFSSVEWVVMLPGERGLLQENPPKEEEGPSPAIVHTLVEKVRI